MTSTEESYEYQTSRPFLRWAGGKRQLLPQLEKYFMDVGSNNKFIEPFIGAGTVFFNVDAENNLINDINPVLMQAYYVLTNNRLFSALKKELSKKKYKNVESTYYKLRDRFNQIKDRNQSFKNINLEKVALFLYLNYCGYNGLYYENKEGKFMVAFGKRPGFNFSPSCIKRLEEVREYIKNRNIKVACTDYKKVLATAKKGDFIYLDPPYYKTVGKTYQDDFSPKDQEDLVKLCNKLDKKGCFILYSNSNTAFIKKLFKKHCSNKWTKKELKATRKISRTDAGRKPTKKIELLMTNY